jgi:ABC-type microcin C transport system permease subunit YejE
LLLIPTWFYGSISYVNFIILFCLSWFTELGVPDRKLLYEFNGKIYGFVCGEYGVLSKS